MVPRIKLMASTRYDKTILKEFYTKGMKKFDNSTNLIISDDWYLLYKISNTSLVLCDWLSLNNGSDFKRTFEMANIISKLLIEHKDLKIETTLRHYTSYRLYSKLKELGYIEELDEYMFLDRNIPKKIGDKVDKIIRFENPETLRKFLKSKESEKFKEYYPYFLHLTEFKVTDKFVKKYGSKN